ncbi:hypothetical protein OROMI_034064 [Orobanche minor]
MMQRGSIPTQGVLTQQPSSEMEQLNNTQQQQPRPYSSSSSRAHHFHPARAAIIDLFNLYLGRSARQKLDESVREPP